MRFGIINLFCPFCKKLFRLNETKGTWHHTEFGHLCSKECYQDAGLKYARMILGKDDE